MQGCEPLLRLCTPLNNSNNNGSAGHLPGTRPHALNTSSLHLQHLLGSRSCYHSNFTEEETGSERLSSGEQAHAWKLTQTSPCQLSKQTERNNSAFPKPACIQAFPGVLVKKHRFLGPDPDLLNQKSQQRGLATCLVNEHPRRSYHGAHCSVYYIHIIK